MKIYFTGKYNISELLSGPEKVAKRLFQYVSAINSQTEFITFGFIEGNRRKMNEIFLQENIIQDKPVILKLGLLKIIFRLLHEKPEIVHIVTAEKYLIPLLLLKSIFRAKFIYTIHGIYKFERKYFFINESIISKIKNSFLEHLLFSKSDHLVFLSKHSVELCRKYYKINQEKLSIIPNGVSNPVNKQSINFNDRGELRIIFFEGSGQSLNRGFDSLIKILNGIRHLKIKLTVLGAKHKNCNLENIEIVYSNYLSEKDLFELLRKHHIYIDSLNYSTFPLLALEAMVNGLITIVSNKCGISDYIDNHVNGFVFDLEKPEEIKTIIEDIFSSDYDLSKISENAIKTTQSLEWNLIAEKYLAIYNRVIND